MGRMIRRDIFIAYSNAPQCSMRILYFFFYLRGAVTTQRHSRLWNVNLCLEINNTYLDIVALIVHHVQSSINGRNISIIIICL
jgi:hypothetical protein